MIILPHLFYEKIVLGYFPDLFKFVKLMDNGEVDGNLGHRFFYSFLARPLEGLIFPGVKSKMLS